MKSMNTVLVTARDRLEYTRLPAERGKGERVQVKYAGVGFADVIARKGGYILAPKIPFSPGYEFMGYAERGGRRERVVGMLPVMNGYREELYVEPWRAVAVPDGVSDDVAAALPLNYLTALALLEKFARLRAGQSVLIHGAGGGVGQAVLELSALLGLRAFGSCSAPKHDRVRRLGATPILRSELEASPESVRDRFGPFDAVLDPFAGPSLRRSWTVLAKGGVLVCFGFAPTIEGGNRALIQGLTWLYAKKLNVDGKRTAVCGTPEVIRRDPAWYAASMRRILTWAEQGAIAPTIHRIVDWRNADRAHAEIEAGTVEGKILLDFTEAA
jgi:NADPH:quinone reductase-like Zn-dependent oxidoreductase